MSAAPDPAELASRYDLSQTEPIPDSHRAQHDGRGLGSPRLSAPGGSRHGGGVDRRAVVTIYSDNEYRSDDLDFICTARERDLTAAMAELGFRREVGRYYVHPDTELFVEFPAPPLAIGNEAVTAVAELRHPSGLLKLLTPTQCVMDRLAAAFHWDDRQALRQAAMVAARPHH